MVGEIRDPETAQVAVQAALTGHLVLSTLHTNDSAGAVMRLMDMGVESYKLAAALVGVVAQRLVRTICPNCRTTYYASAEYLEALHFTGDKRRSLRQGRRLPRLLRHGLSRPQGHLRSVALRRRTAPADRPRRPGRRRSAQWLADHGHQTAARRRHCASRSWKKQAWKKSPAWRSSSNANCDSRLASNQYHGSSNPRPTPPSPPVTGARRAAAAHRRRRSRTAHRATPTSTSKTKLRSRRRPPQAASPSKKSPT